MRRLILALLLLLPLLAVPCSGAEVPSFPQVDELLEELRSQGYTDPQKVEYAILETNGRVSVILYANQRPVTAEQMNLFPDDVGLPLVIIDDGRLLERNLKLRGFNEGWLQKRLEEHNVHNVRDVFLLSVDEQNRVYFVPREVGKG